MISCRFFFLLCFLNQFGIFIDLALRFVDVLRLMLFYSVTLRASTLTTCTRSLVKMVKRTWSDTTSALFAPLTYCNSLWSLLERRSFGHYKI